MYKIYGRVAGLLCCLLTGVTVASNVDVVKAKGGFHFVEDPVDARLVAMGSAGSASGGYGFSFYNPAQPALRGKSYVTLQYGQQQSDVRKSFFETSLIFQNWFFGVSANNRIIDDIIPSNEQGINPNVSYSSPSLQLSATVGMTREFFSVAACFNYLDEKLAPDAHYQAVSASAGALYQVLPGKLNLGLAAFQGGYHDGKFKALGRSTLQGASRWGDGPQPPRSARAGASWSDSLKSIHYFLSADIVYNYTHRNIIVPFGLEILPIEFLAIRGGKKFNSDTDIFNFGIGILKQPLCFDISLLLVNFETTIELNWLTAIAYEIPSFR